MFTGTDAADLMTHGRITDEIEAPAGPLAGTLSMIMAAVRRRPAVARSRWAGRGRSSRLLVVSDDPRESIAVAVRRRSSHVFACGSCYFALHHSALFRVGSPARSL